MAKREYTLELSPQSADEISKMLQTYIDELETKRKLLVTELAQLGLPVIDRCMASAYEPITQPYDAFIDVYDYKGFTKASLRLRGTEVLFVEFGAGVHFNGATSPNPYASQLGYTIGGYGHHRGLHDFWFYKDGSGQVVKSHGTKATMPMYRSYEEICNKFLQIAESVFV